MELYKIIATCTNDSETHTFKYIPEGFEGVKITQSFSFVNPMGYTPKFSIDTMRSIEDDKTFLDEKFDTYGLLAVVNLDIKKLDVFGYDYESISQFTIDFESFEKFDVYSEFALKSISTIDFYNNIKNTEIQIDLTENAILPTTQNYINYVSLKSTGLRQVDAQYAVFQFEPNNDSKIYNLDTSLYDTNKEIVYWIGNTETDTIKTSMSGIIKLNCTVAGYVAIRFFIDGNPFGGLDVNLSLGLNEINISELISDYTSTFTVGQEVRVAIESFDATEFDAVGYEQNLFVDLKRATDIKVIPSENQIIKYAYTSEILNTIFNNNVSFPASPILDSGLTSSSHLDSMTTFANLKPKDFLSDFCLMAGLLINFKKDGTVNIDFISNYFNDLMNILHLTNVVEITDFKDLSIKYNSDLNFSSVSVGQEIKDYDFYTYFINWNKVLTFNQDDRNATENLNLALQKFRVDFSGILDYYLKRSQQKTNVSKDNFIFNTNFDEVWYEDDLILYDIFTPRNILANWRKFLSFCFQNYGLNTLTISSNGGTVDNLNISGVNQMDDIVLSETPRLLPLEYNFTCLIEDVDFSEKILKINDNGVDIYLFVINAETTDSLSEQKIKGLKIEFPTVE